MADEINAEGGAVADAHDSEEAMHVHAPKPFHGWGELLREVGVIVVGIVIAIGLEQTVEALHRHHQRETLEADLRRDGELNRRYLKSDIVQAQAILDWAVEQASTVDRAGPTGALILRRLPGGFIGVTDAGVWPSAKASGVVNLLPSDAQNWLEYLAQQYDEAFVSRASATGRLYDAYAALDQVIVGRAAAGRSGDIDLSALTPAQRSTAADRLRAIAESARGVVRQLLVCDIGNEFILSTPLDQLDSPSASDRYQRIRQKALEAHPAANYSFGDR
ncbi:MAG TPA: hypothetical protein VG407_13835 [Caulobacteraceae bacterium]|jgi:hypothetical protein|nr:hypothetical protein [Caulobacteraceae bacterium]